MTYPVVLDDVRADLTASVVFWRVPLKGSPGLGHLDGPWLARLCWPVLHNKSTDEYNQLLLLPLVSRLTCNGDEERGAVFAQFALQLDGILPTVRPDGPSHFEDRAVLPFRLDCHPVTIRDDGLVLVIPRDDGSGTPGEFHSESNDVTFFKDETLFVFFGQDGPWRC